MKSIGRMKMKTEQSVYTFVWNDDFILLEEGEKPSLNDIVLYIDEESQYMRLIYPSSTNNIIRTKLQSKLMFIQKRGLLIESLNQRVGKNYEFHIDSESLSTPISQNGISENSLSPSASSQESEINKQIESTIKIIKQIWIHKRTHDGTDLINQEEYGQPEKYVQFRASDFEKLDIKIRSLPDSIMSTN